MELDSNKATANCAINYSISLNASENKEYYDTKMSNLLKIN